MNDTPYRPPRSARDLGDPFEELDHTDFITPSLLRRWAGSLIDQVIMVIILLPVGILAGVLLEGGGVDIETLPDSVFTVPAFLLIGLFNSVLESSPWHGSVGKRVLGMEVIHMEGRYISFPESLGRNLAKWVSLALCGLLSLTVLDGRHNRGLWDRAASTRVVQKNPYAD